METLSQRDKRWADKRLGFSTSNRITLGTDGCLVVALTMLLNRVFKHNYSPDEVNEKLKQVGAFAANSQGQRVLLIWGRVPVAFPELKFIKRAVNYWNAEVAIYVYIRKLPVLVEVNAASIGAPRHWVLYLGNGKCADPWTGKISSTYTYPPTGYSLYQKA